MQTSEKICVKRREENDILKCIDIDYLRKDSERIAVTCLYGGELGVSRVRVLYSFTFQMTNCVNILLFKK